MGTYSPFFDTRDEAIHWLVAQNKGAMAVTRAYRTRKLHRWRAWWASLDNGPVFSRDALLLINLTVPAQSGTSGNAT